MGFSLESAKQTITHPALAYNFVLKGIPNVDPLNIKSAAIPSKKIDDIPIKLRGRTLHYVGNLPQYSTMPVTFIDDISFTTRTMLEMWTQVIADNETGYGFITPLVTKDLYLYLLAPGSDLIIAAYTLHNSFISDLAQVQLSYESTTTVVSYTGTIVYDYFTRADVADFSNVRNVASSLGF